MVSSASDLVRWAQAIRRGELLGPAMQQEVFTYYPPEDPQNSQEEYYAGRRQESKNFYNHRAVLGHGGGTLGFTAAMYWLENTDVTIVLLTNVGCMHSGLKSLPGWDVLPRKCWCQPP